jgi:hypothetical protein
MSIQRDSLAQLASSGNSVYEGEREQLIKEAARAILASDVKADEGTRVPIKAVAALIHHVADMMEE